MSRPLSPVKRHVDHFAHYKPPACVKRRPGIGNYLYIKDPATGQRVKRFDGVHNGVEAKVHDPRLQIPKEVRERGQGYMKNRSKGVEGLHYEVSHRAFIYCDG